VLALCAQIAAVVIVFATTAPWGVAFAVAVLGYLVVRITDPRTWHQAMRKAAADFAHRWRNP